MVVLDVTHSGLAQTVLRKIPPPPSSTEVIWVLKMESVMFLRDADSRLQIHSEPQPRRLPRSFSPPSELKKQVKCIPLYCNMAYEPKGKGMKTKRIWVCYMIKFINCATCTANLSASSATFTVELNACCSSTNLGLLLQIKDFVRNLEGNRQQRCRFTSGTLPNN